MTQDPIMVEFNKDKLIKFKKAYDKATDELKTVFTFEGNEYDLGYAKYLIEYLEGKLTS
jgi:hypothetical protein